MRTKTRGYKSAERRRVGALSRLERHLAKLNQQNSSEQQRQALAVQRDNLRRKLGLS